MDAEASGSVTGKAIDLACRPSDEPAISADPECAFPVSVCRLDARAGKVFAGGTNLLSAPVHDNLELLFC